MLNSKFHSNLNWKYLLATMLLLFSTNIAASAGVHPDVKTMVQAEEAPEGVVFEVETLEENALAELAEYIKVQVEEVKKAFPDVDIAVVSHGVEEYSLQTKNQAKQASMHNLFNQLVSQQDVSLHVCGAVAGLGNLSQEDFPDYVSYSDSGMAQINDYKALGYQVVVIKQLTEKQRKALFTEPEKYLK